MSEVNMYEHFSCHCSQIIYDNYLHTKCCKAPKSVCVLYTNMAFYINVCVSGASAEFRIRIYETTLFALWSFTLFLLASPLNHPLLCFSWKHEETWSSFYMEDAHSRHDQKVA